MRRIRINKSRIIEKKQVGKFLSFAVFLFMGGILLGGCGDQKANTANASSLAPGASWEFTGKVEKIDSGLWTISQRQVQVDGSTLVGKDPAPVVGSQVQVQGTTKENGILAATSINVEISIGKPPVAASGTLTPLSYSIPTVTPSGNAGATTADTQTAPKPGQPAASPFSSTGSPAGTTVQDQGIIQQITANGNNRLIVVNNKEFLLEPYFVRVLGQRLVEGATVKLVGRFNDNNQIVVSTVVNIYPPARPNEENQSDKGNNKSKDKGGKEGD